MINYRTKKPANYAKKRPVCHTATAAAREKYCEKYKIRRKFLNTSDIQRLNGVCLASAQRIANRIKDFYNADRTTRPTVQHYCSYYSINPIDLEIFLDSRPKR